MLTEDQKEYIRINFRLGREKIAETLKCSYDDVSYFFSYGLMRNKEVQQYYKVRIHELNKLGLRRKEIAEKLEVSIAKVDNVLFKSEGKAKKEEGFKLPGLDNETSKTWDYIKKKAQENKIAVMDLKIKDEEDIKKLDKLTVRNLIEKLESEKPMCVRIKVLGEI
jgi:predicted transcriptional regulator